MTWRYATVIYFVKCFGKPFWFKSSTTNVLNEFGNPQDWSCYSKRTDWLWHSPKTFEIAMASHQQKGMSITEVQVWHGEASKIPARWFFTSTSAYDIDATRNPTLSLLFPKPLLCLMLLLCTNSPVTNMLPFWAVWIFIRSLYGKPHTTVTYIFTVAAKPTLKQRVLPLENLAANRIWMHLVITWKHCTYTGVCFN